MTNIFAILMLVGITAIACVGASVILIALGALVFGVGRAAWRWVRVRRDLAKLAGRVLG